MLALADSSRTGQTCKCASFQSHQLASSAVRCYPVLIMFGRSHQTAACSFSLHTSRRRRAGGTQPLTDYSLQIAATVVKIRYSATDLWFRPSFPNWAMSLTLPKSIRGKLPKIRIIFPLENVHILCISNFHTTLPQSSWSLFPSLPRSTRIRLYMSLINMEIFQHILH